MELYKIKVENFCSYKKLELDLYKQGLIWIGGTNNDTTSADSNGSGKTTLFKAVTWALYGDTIDSDRGDTVIKNGEIRASVELSLIDSNNCVWRVVRNRMKGKPKLSFINPDNEEVSGDNKEIQNRIIEAIGLDFKSFKNTVLYGQNDSSRFACPTTKDSERKTMLHKILRTDMLSECNEVARSKANELKKQIETNEHEIDILEAKIDAVDIEDLEFRYNSWEDKTKKEIEEIKLKNEEYKKISNEYLEKAESYKIDVDIEAIEKKIRTLQKEADDIDIDEDLVGELAYKIKNKEEVKEWLTVDVGLNKATVKSNKQKLKDLDGDICPICTSNLKSGNAKKHVSSIKKENRKLKSQIELANKDLDDLDNEINILNTRLTEVDAKLSKQDYLLKKIDSIKANELYDAKIATSKVEIKKKELETTAKIYSDKYKLALTKIMALKQTENPFSEQLEKAKTIITENKKTIKQLQKTTEQIRTEYAHYIFWVKGFSNQGLPSYILDGVMSFITDRANNYLEILTDGDISLEFRTQRELKNKKGAMKDEIEIQWTIEGIQNRAPSGGQLKKIEIATDLALMDLVADREQGQLDILMLDEVLDGLDNEGCNRVITLLKQIRKNRGSIFVISHEPRVSEFFERSLFAVKTNGTTELKK